MVSVIFLCCLLGANFKQVAYFPHGTWSFPPLLGGYDVDHDDKREIFIPVPFDTGTIVSEHIGNNQYNHDTKIYFMEIEALGYGDNDSLIDACGLIIDIYQVTRGLGIYESRRYGSYPDSLIWFIDSTIFAAPCQFIDFDKDGLMNIVIGYMDSNVIPHFCLFENTGNNLYEKRFEYQFSGSSGVGELVIDNFDGDSLLEIVGGTADGKVCIYENTEIGVDSFQLVWTYKLPFANANIKARGNDMDCDGKLEFIVGTYVYDKWCFTLFETNGNNSYEKKWQYFYYYGGSLSKGDVACGDIDGDGIDEMVTFGGMVLNVWKCVGPDSYTSIWNRWYIGDLTGAVLLVYDLNRNGLAEIVVSGGNWGPTPPAKTYIYEKTPIVTWVYPRQYDTLWAKDTVDLIWRLDETVSLDSLRIYFSNPQLGCHLVYQGLPQDTTCRYIVPDTHSNMSCRFWIAVKGYLRYDSIVSHPFYIKRRVGVEEYATGSLPGAMGLEVYPNPFREKIVIKYPLSSGYQEKDLLPTIRIYDATGRLVKTLNLFPNNHLIIQPLRRQNYGTTAPINQLVWFGDDDLSNKVPSGVYFVCLQKNERLLVKKIIKLE